VCIEKTDCQTVALEVLTKVGERVPIPDSVKPLFAVLHFRRPGYRTYYYIRNGVGGLRKNLFSSHYAWMEHGIVSFLASQIREVKSLLNHGVRRIAYEALVKQVIVHDNTRFQILADNGRLV
jgi:hypothetical protein